MIICRISFQNFCPLGKLTFQYLIQSQRKSVSCLLYPKCFILLLMVHQIQLIMLDMVLFLSILKVLFANYVDVSLRMLLHEVEAEAIKKALIFIKSQVQFYVQFIFYSDSKSVIESLKKWY